MSWSAPAIFWYLPLAALPVIIYYWMRRHPVAREWGAHYVLDLALRKLKRKLLNEHVILLVLRVLIALFLILAFARLVRDGRRRDQLVHSGVHRVIVLDASYSQLAGDTGQTRWDVTKEALAQLLATWGRGESYSLYVMDDDPGWLIEYAVVGKDLDNTEKLLAIRPSESVASLAKALQDIRDRFTIEDVDLFLFVDDQATTWSDLTEVMTGTAPRRTYWLNPPVASYANAAVTSVMAANERCLKDQPARIFVSVKDFSDSARDVKVEFLQNGEVVGERTVSLHPGLEEQTFFDARFETPGSHYVAARLRPDILRYDDLHTAGLHVEDHLKIMVLRDEDSEPHETAWPVFEQIDLLHEALEKTPLIFSLHEGACTPETLVDQDVAFIDGSKTIDKTLAALLTDFVERGGGLILAAGIGTDRERWNSLLGLAGMLPARLGDDPTWKFNPTTTLYKRLSYHGFGNKALKAFATLEAGRIGETQFFHWFDLLYDEDQTDPNDILLRFDDHRAYIMRKKLKLGQVLLLASGLNGLDNTFPVRETFMPFLYRLCRAAAAGKMHPRTLRTREPLRYRVSRPDGLDAMALQFEADASVPLVVKTVGGVTSGVHPPGLTRSGMGRVIDIRGSTVRRTYFGVQGERVDSDLTPLDPAAEQRWLDRWKIVEFEDGATLVRALLKGQEGREMYPFVAMLAALLMLAELAYQRRFTRIAE